MAKINLASRRLRFSNPLRFNDPFDCYFPPAFANLRRNVAAIEKRHHAIMMGDEMLPEGSEAEFNMAPLISLVGTVPPEVIERTRKSHKARLLAVANEYNLESQREWEDTLRQFRILSLCAERDNPLLWAHYADCHKGMALEFDSSASAGIRFSAAVPVRYRKRVPRAYSRSDFIENALGLNPLPETAKAILPLVLTKSDEWRYEKEWRIVRMVADEQQEPFADLAFSPRSLTRIFLGCRCTVRARKAVERLAARDLKHVEIHQARPSKSRYELEYEQVR